MFFLKKKTEMVSLEEKIIYRSKTKIVLLVCGSILFVGIGLYLLFLNTEVIERYGRFSNPLIIRGAGIAAISFFGFCGYIGIRKFLNGSPGLVLNKEGLSDESSALSLGRVPWSEISGVGECEVQKQKFVSIFLENSEKYINTGSFLTKMVNRTNFKMCGTPINISANTLQLNHEELLDCISLYYKTYSNKVEV